MPRLKQKNTHSRQRQRLIDACISALHSYGPSRTTVARVVAIAKMSPGIVRFYFASKAAMLVASLQFLASEFEEQVLAPVSRLKDKPVAALRLLVELYLDPNIASPRKVSVWYAFWGEASSRQEYYDICGQKDEGFAALVRELIERLILLSGHTQLDADGIALGLIGVLEMLWQDFAFKDERDIDRAAAKGRAMAYLRSVFPGQFTVASRGAGSDGGANASLSAWAYDSARLYAMEREHVFQRAWQFIAHRADLEAAGDFVSSDLGFDRALVVRGNDGELRAFRNSCPAAPHALVAPGRGRQQTIRCAVHALSFELDGHALGGGGDLLCMEVRELGDLVLVRSADRLPGNAGFPDRWREMVFAPAARALPARADTLIAADWKVVAELFLGQSASPPSQGWSARCYQRLTAHPAAAARRYFLAPNHWLSVRPDGWTLLQILPLGPGRCSLRQYRYTWCEADAAAMAAQYLTERLFAIERLSGLAVAESIQRGIADLGHQSSQIRSAELTAFHRQLLSILPVMGLDKPLSDF
jgi:TetR/AcrR family transcriptional regulator, transcriptional repressor of bet genes